MRQNEMHPENDTRKYVVLIYVFTTVMIILIPVFYMRYVKRDKKLQPVSDAERFSLLERKLIASLLTYEGGMSSQQVNTILELDHKQPENQRRIRNEVISEVNQKINLSLGVKMAVQRLPDPLDRRLVVYKIDSEVRLILEKMVEV